jgi:hypothetical protein
MAMSNDTTNWNAAAAPVIRKVSPLLKLARREFDGVAVTLLWSRESNVLAVTVFDIRDGNFELVLAPNELFGAMVFPAIPLEKKSTHDWITRTGGST